MKKMRTLFLVLAMVVVLAMAISPVSASPSAQPGLSPSMLNSRPPNWVGPCTVRAFPGSNGNLLLEHTKYLDVYGVPTGGYFIYYYGSASGSMMLSPWGIYGSALRFGVPTSWYVFHMNWKSYNWYYTNWSGCSLSRGY